MFFNFICLFALLFLVRGDKFEGSSTSIYTSGPVNKLKDTDVLPAVNETGKGGWVMYKQCDGRWANQQLGYCSQTICSAGCAMTSVAMMLTSKGTNMDPGALDSYLTRNGGYANGCEIIWSAANNFGTVRFVGMQVANEWEICNGLSQNHGIVANVNGGGHWVLLTGCAGNGNFYVNDPGYSRSTYSIGEILQEAVYH
jgi:hypothetical protein